MPHDLDMAIAGVRLRPLVVDDAYAFRAIIDAEMWAGNSTPFPDTLDSVREHLAASIAHTNAAMFAVEVNGELVGRTALYDVVSGVRCEIGHTIYARKFWGSHVNPAAKLMLFTHAFEQMGMHRVALRCDSRNTRSHRAIARLGARFEGTMRSFRPAADGTICDVDYFSVIASEWPGVKKGLMERLDGKGKLSLSLSD